MPTNDHQATGNQSGVWWRTRWQDAMATSDLKPLARLVAYVYAEHARDGRLAWVTTARLVERTGMARSTAIKQRTVLVDEGWLIQTEKARHHKTGTYALVIPEAFRGPSPGPLEETGVRDTDSRGPSPEHQGSVSRTQSISNQEIINLSPNARALQKVLECSPEDERLRYADKLIEAHDVRSASAWLRTAKANGTLDERLHDVMNTRPSHRTIPNDYWESGGQFFNDDPKTDDYLNNQREVAFVECKTRDSDGSPCGQMIRETNLHLPCPICGEINQQPFKVVSA